MQVMEKNTNKFEILIVCNRPYYSKVSSYVKQDNVTIVNKHATSSRNYES
jgi:hypothetical protein